MNGPKMYDCGVMTPATASKPVDAVNDATRSISNSASGAGSPFGSTIAQLPINAICISTPNENVNIANDEIISNDVNSIPAATQYSPAMYSITLPLLSCGMTPVSALFASPCTGAL